jgi:hypothetical protein
MAVRLAVEAVLLQTPSPVLLGDDDQGGWALLQERPKAAAAV